jgi:hypothetical protein
MGAAYEELSKYVKYEPFAMRAAAGRHLQSARMNAI